MFIRCLKLMDNLAYNLVSFLDVTRYRLSMTGKKVFGQKDSVGTFY